MRVVPNSALFPRSRGCAARSVARVVPQPSSTAAPRALLRETLLLALAVAALLLIWRPSVVEAQETKPSSTPPARATSPRTAPGADSTRVHEVRASETLWSIATRYYGNGQAWRAIAKRNGIPISQDTALRVGAKLVLPPLGSLATSRVADADTTTPRMVNTPAAAAPVDTSLQKVVVTKKPSSLAEQTTNKGDAGSARTPAARPATAANPAAVADTSAMQGRDLIRPTRELGTMLSRGPQRLGLADDAAVRAARGSRETGTVFYRDIPTTAEVRAVATSASARFVAEPRRGELDAAPLVETGRAPLERAGRIVRKLGEPEPRELASSFAPRLHLDDQVELTVPVGATAAVGDRYLAVRLAPLGVGGHSLLLPTGVVRVSEVASGAVRGTVQSISGILDVGEALIKAEGTPADPNATLVAAAADVKTSVAWVDPHELIPTLQTWLVLGAGSANGVRAGDVFRLTEPGKDGAEVEIAKVRVVRASAAHATAIVIAQREPRISAGLAAARVARMP